MYDSCVVIRALTLYYRSLQTASTLLKRVIRKQGGHYVDSIQGRVLLGILMELKEEYTLRVMFQQETKLLVP
jgi:hypothetical protein